jgi:hypothetical protein
MLEVVLLMMRRRMLVLPLLPVGCLVWCWAGGH